MDNISVLIDCVDKTYSLKIGKRLYTDLPVRPTYLTIEGGKYEVDITWSEDEALPVVNVSTYVREEDERGDYYDKKVPLNVSYSVSISNGDRNDFLGVKFPNGFSNWYQTFSYIQEILIKTRRIKRIDESSIEKIRDLTFRFEEKYSYKVFFDIDFKDTLTKFIENDYKRY